MVLKFTLSLNVIVKMMKNLSKSTKNSRLVQINYVLMMHSSSQKHKHSTELQPDEA